MMGEGGLPPLALLLRFRYNGENQLWEANYGESIHQRE